MANIIGTSGNDTLIGTVNADSINGLAGEDTLYGQAGNDTLLGGVGNDWLLGRTGNDVLAGGAGNDVLYGGDSRDTIDKGAGNDTYQFGIGAGVDHIQDFDVTVGNTDVALFNGVASTAVSALERRGNDLVITYSASDQLIMDAYFGQRGNQVELFKFSNGVTWDEAAIKARVITVGTALNDSIAGYDDGTNRIYGLDGNDTLVGGALADLINGGNGHDTLYGQAGNDTLLGDVGNDWLSGGAGDDTLNGGVGDDYMDAGLGTDTVSYTSATVGVMVDLGLITAQNTVGAGIDTVLNFENVMGSNFNDNLKGNAGNNVLNGRGGNDVLNGLAGVDTASYVDASVGVTVNLGLTTAQNTVGAGTDTLLSIENLTGSNFNDSLTGNAGNNVLSGGKGNDTINGGSGNDTLIGGLGVDTLNGGLGNDTFDYDAVSESPVGTGRDIITGFSGVGAALGDRIDLTTIDANSLVAGNQAFIFGGSFTAGHLRYVGGVLQGNTDADVAAEFEIQLVGAPALVVGGAGTDILL